MYEQGKNDLKPNVNFIKMFNNFFEKKVDMKSTYKPIFLRALADIGKYDQYDLIGKKWIDHRGDVIVLDLDFIAVRFAKYYWDMELAFGMIHAPTSMTASHVKKTDIKILTLIRNEGHIVKDGKPPTLRYLASSSMKEFRKKVILDAMKWVLDSLPTDFPNLYKLEENRLQILLDPGIIDFMREFSPIIKKALNYKLAIHLEKHNPSARYIAIKIDEENELEKRLKSVESLERQRRKNHESENSRSRN